MSQVSVFGQLCRNILKCCTKRTTDSITTPLQAFYYCSVYKSQTVSFVQDFAITTVNMQLLCCLYTLSIMHSINLTSKKIKIKQQHKQWTFDDGKHKIVLL